MSEITWFCGHAVFYYKFVTGPQDSVLVHENVFLVSASDELVAKNQVEALAREQEDLRDDGSLQLNDRPVHYIFAGIRKLIEVELNSETASGKLPSGTEVTYSEFEVDTVAQVSDLAAGKFVPILYRE